MEENKTCESCERLSHRTPEQNRALVNRLKRIEGQIRGLQKMVEENVYCDNILQQAQAASSALSGFNRELLGLHIKSCVVDGLKAGDEEIVDELLLTMKGLLK